MAQNRNINQTILVDGSVGIGTTSPDRGLTISRSNQYASLNIYKTNTTNQIVYLGTGSSGADDDAILQLFDEATEKVRIFTAGNSWFNGGNVGIGETSPSTKLYIKNTAGDADITLQGSSQTMRIDQNSIRTTTASQIHIFTNNTTTNGIYISSSGNVLIGTTTDAGYKLDVNGTVNASGGFRTSDNVFTNYIRDISGVKYISLDGTGIKLEPAGYGQTVLQAVSTGVNITGNVGIGTTSPSYALDIERTTGEVAIQLQARDDSSNTAIYFGDNSDADVGSLIYNQGSNYMSFTTNAGERMRINSSGNVGIGTTSPSYKIHAQTNAATWGYRFENNTGDQDVHTFLSHGAGYGIAVDSTSNSSSTYLLKLAGGAGGTGLGSVEHFRVTSAGNVGIGTTSPGNKLHVNGDIIRVVNSTYAGIESHNTNGTWESYVGTEFGGGGNRYNSASSQHTFYNNSSPVMRITSAGNVGIGTTSPVAKLEVNGTFTSTGDTILANAINSPIKNVNNYPVFEGQGASAQFGFSRAGSSNATYIGSDSTYLFRLWNESFNNDYLNVLRTGNVGIGTTSPNAKLDVAGDIWLSETGRLQGRAYPYDTTVGSGADASTTIVDAGSTSGYRSRIILAGGNATDPNTIKFLTTSAERMRITSAGNVGIGTASPTKTLHIYTTGNEGIFLQGTGGGVWMDMQASGGQIHSIGAQVGGMGIYNRTLGAYRMFITDGGNVGIGTTSPVSPLDVNGVISSRGISIAQNSGTYNLIYNASNSVAMYIGGSADPATYYDNLYHYFRSNSGSTTYGVWNSIGLGIGTASPSQRLHVVGHAWINRPSNKVDNNGATEFGSRVEFNNSFASGQTGYMVFRYPTYNNFLIGGDYDGNIGGGIPNIQFGRSNGTVYMHIDANGGTGNVGIGTTSPAEKLEVAGNIRATEGGITSYRTSNEAQVLVNFSGNQMYMFNNSASYGLYSTDYGSLFIRTKSTGLLNIYDKIYATSSGNVGIGTTSPSAKLEISGFSTGAGLKLNYGNSSGTIEAVNFIANGGANGVIGMQMVSAGVGDLWLGGSGGRALTLYRDGNVGIGTNSPAVPLDVAGKIRSVNANDQLTIKRSDNTGTRIGHDALGLYFANDDTSLDVLRVFGGTTGAERMRITSAGNVLIGTTTDNGKKLHVNGDVFIKGSTSSSAYADAIFEVQNSNGTSIMDFRGDAYAFFGCGQGGGAASGFIFRYNDTAHVQFTGYNYGNGAGSYKPILLDTDLVGRSQGIYVNYGGTGYSYPAPISDAEFAVRGRTADATEKAARLDDSNGAELFSVRNDGAIFTQSNQGWSGTVNFPTNAPGQQNLQFVNGILINVF